MRNKKRTNFKYFMFTISPFSAWLLVGLGCGIFLQDNGNIWGMLIGIIGTLPIVYTSVWAGTMLDEMEGEDDANRE